MLVLTRKEQQTIRIGENVTITILRVKGQAVRVGIEAPRDIHIVRGELPPKSMDAADTPAKETEILEVTTLPSVSLSHTRNDRGADANERPHTGENARVNHSLVRSTTASPRRGLQPQVSSRRVTAVTRLNGEPIDVLQRQTLLPLRSTLGYR